MIAEAGHVPFPLTVTLPSRLSSVALISIGGSGAVDTNDFVKSFQEGSHDFAGAGSRVGWSWGRSGVLNEARRIYILKAGVGRAYVTLIEVGAGIESVFNQ